MKLERQLEQTDRFELMYKEQLALQEYIAKYKPEIVNLPDMFSTENLRTCILLLIKEATELLDEMDFKPHLKTHAGGINEDRFKEELVDVFKFWLNLGIAVGLSPDDIFIEFQRKSAIVYDRFKERFEGLESAT